MWKSPHFSNPTPPSDRITVTSAVVSKWSETARSQASLGSVKYLVKAFRMACHYGDPEEEVGAIHAWETRVPYLTLT